MRAAAAAILSFSVIIVAAAAGCSSSSHSGNPASGTGSGSGATPSGASGSPAGAPLTIGVIGSFSGDFASSLGPAKSAMEAWAAWTNANGGIAGHPVKLVIKDDQGSPATSTTAVKELVESDHVIAIVTDASVVDSAWSAYVKTAGVPVVGYSVNDNTTNSDFYTLPTTPLTLAKATVKAAIKAGKSHFGVLYCAEAPTCLATANEMKSVLSSAGMAQPFVASISASAPNYTAQCVAARQAGVDVMAINDASAVASKVVDDCAKQHYTPLQVIGEASADYLKDPAFEGAVDVAFTFSDFQTSTPAQRDFLTAMAKYAPGVSTSGALPPSAWASGQLFAAAATAANLGDNATAMDVVRGLDMLHDVTLDGLLPKTNFSRGTAPTDTCFFMPVVQNGHYEFPYGSDPVCTKS